MKNRIVVAIAGHFDPIHRGHLDHIRKAKALGDYLVVMLNPDRDLTVKRAHSLIPNLIPYEEREAILLDNKYVDQVVKIVDTDGTCAETLKLVNPDIFAKGGDRSPKKVPIPPNEIQVCKGIGCRIVYGVGDTLNSSSDLLRVFIKKFLDLIWEKVR